MRNRLSLLTSMRHLHVVVCACIASMYLQPAAVAETETQVVIEGGSVDGGHNYNWTVTNQQASPIVYIEIPHYRANLFFAPEGWSTKSTHLVQVGSKDKPGVCTATAESQVDGIMTGRSGAFRMQVGDTRSKPRSGTVLIRFEDGTKHAIDGVQVPTPETVGDKYMTLIGLGSIFLIWIVIAQVRRRRSGKSR